ncbi:hypothetical protein Tco_1217335 [Tanacetum coccineum]
MEGSDAMLENGPWFIRNNPLILKKWHPDENLLKEDVSTIPVWVKLYGVPVMAFNEDGLSAIATKLGTPLMLDSYTSEMCMQSWGRSSYARAMIELQADVELKDNIVAAMPTIAREGHYTCNIRVEYEWKPPRLVPKKSTTSSSGNKKKGVEPSIEVSNSNPFEVLNSVDNDVELGTNGGTTNLVNNEATSSGSSFINIDNSSTRTTPIIDKIEMFKELLTSGKATLVDEAGNPLKKVEFLNNYDSEDEVTSVDNDMAHPYDDDMYKGQDLSQELQAICDNLDIRVRGKPFTQKKNAKLISTLIENGFSQSKSDYSLYTKSDKGVFLALLVYMDDIIITGNSVYEIEKFKVYLKSKFMIKDLGKLKFFLRIEVVDTIKGICLNQRKYVLDLLSEYGMLACKPARTPLMQDISYAVHCLSQFMHSPLTSHLKIAFKILRYLKSCPGLGIHITKISGMFLNAYSNADWAKCIVTRKYVTSEDEVASVDNDMAHSLASERVDPHDDDMYEGQDLPQEIQAICDNLDIRV